MVAGEYKKEILFALCWLLVPPEVERSGVNNIAGVEAYFEMLGSGSRSKLVFLISLTEQCL